MNGGAFQVDAWLRSRMEAEESAAELLISTRPGSLETEFLPTLGSCNGICPAQLPRSRCDMSVQGPAFVWLLTNLSLAHTQDPFAGKGPAGSPMSAVWTGPTEGAGQAMAGTWPRRAMVAGQNLADADTPVHVRTYLAPDAAMPRDLGEGVFRRLVQSGDPEASEAGILSGGLGTLAALFLLATAVSSVVASLI